MLFIADMEVEPSIATMVLNFENKFDPYKAISTPLYQTATFKQVIMRGSHFPFENICVRLCRERERER